MNRQWYKDRVEDLSAGNNLGLTPEETTRLIQHHRDYSRRYVTRKAVDFFRWLGWK